MNSDVKLLVTSVKYLKQK